MLGITVRHRGLSRAAITFSNDPALLRLLSSTPSVSAFDAAVASETSPDDQHLPAVRQFAVDYLVSRFNFSHPEALKASKHLLHLQSATKPEAVLAFLHREGLADAAPTVVARNPKILSTSVDKYLAPLVANLAGLGFSSSQIAMLLAIPFRASLHRFIWKIQFLIELFGSVDNMIQMVSTNSHILSADLENVIKPNFVMLRKCGIDARHIAKRGRSWILTRYPDTVRSIISRAEEFGVPRNSPMFQYFIWITKSNSAATIDAKLEYMMSLGWSKAAALSAIGRQPTLLSYSQQKFEAKVNFLVKTVGLDIQCLASMPRLLIASLELKLVPRYAVMKALWERGLSKYSFYSAILMSENKFLQKFVLPYEGQIPGFVDTYAAAVCSGIAPDKCLS